MQGWYWVANKIDLNEKSEVELLPSCFLRRATKEQIEDIKAVYPQLNEGQWPFAGVNPYEVSYQPTEGWDKGGLAYKSVKILDKEKFDYFILEVSRDMPSFLISALAISNLDLTIMAWKEVGMKGIGFDYTLANSFWGDTVNYGGKPPTELTKNALDDLEFVFKGLSVVNKADSEYNFIAQAIYSFLELRQLSYRSPLKSLGYIAVLEGLISESGHLKSGNSISFQLKNKINLLNNRLDEPINLNDYFGELPGTMGLVGVIEKVYLYRNKIAHGGEKDFTDKLQHLRNEYAVVFFLKSLTRKLLRLAINEPRLVCDLKQC